MVETNMYANKFERLMITIMASLFVMLIKVDDFKLMLNLCITKNVYYQTQMRRKHLKTRGMLIIHEEV